MKKTILLMAISLSIFATQSCDNDKKAKEDKTVSASEVPAAVQSAFSAKYSTVSDVKWEEAHEDSLETYKVKFVRDGKKMKAEFDTKGGFIKEDEDN